MYYHPKFRKTRNLFGLSRFNLLCAYYRLPFEKLRNDTAALRIESTKTRVNIRHLLLAKQRFKSAFPDEKHVRTDVEERNGKESAGKLAITKTISDGGKQVHPSGTEIVMCSGNAGGH